jgi:leucine dehydrogenase
MKIFELMKKHNQEQVAFYADKSVKLRAMLAIHSTALGPAIGGIRLYKYESVSSALFDLTRLSEGMTLKVAAGGCNFGGGYIVVVDQEGMDKKELTFRSLGRFIESFKGRFIAGGEIGTTEESMEFIAMETRYITGLPAYYGGSGNHSYMGAYGTYKGIKAAAKYKWDSDSLDDKKVVIQGFGRTGSQLADFVKKEGAQVLITDKYAHMIEQAKTRGFETIPYENMYTEPCDFFVPCAVGAIINPATVDKFQCKIIAGSANNQLLNDDDDVRLKKRGILYTPDFIINVGGIIDVSEEYLGYKKERVLRKTENIYDRVLEILKYADDNDISTNESAVQYALKRIESVKQIRGRSMAEETSPGRRDL